MNRYLNITIPEVHLHPDGCPCEVCKAVTFRSSTITVLNRIGAGIFSIVERGFVESERETVALKRSRIYKHLEAELGALSRLSTSSSEFAEGKWSYITQFLGIVADESGCCCPRNTLVFEHMSNGSLLQMLRRGFRFDEAALTAVSFSVLQALKVLEACGIGHRAVEPGNILCDGEGNLKLSDFGCAILLPIPTAYADVPVTSSATELEKDAASLEPMDSGGSWRYVSPERYERQPYSYASDIWSLGATLVHLDSGLPPYPNCIGYWDIRDEVFKAANTLPIGGNFKSFPEGFQCFLRTLFRLDPLARTTAALLLQNFDFAHERLSLPDNR